VTQSTGARVKQEKVITPADIEHQIGGITGETSDTTREVTQPALVAGTAILVGFVICVFVIGKRLGKKQRTIVEVVRI
jgi:hypothetical protein|tara:strand:+ start:332 stop:565 length:234 start_codon:yes stop_codon:yes gene_type:complete